MKLLIMFAVTYVILILLDAVGLAIGFELNDEIVNTNNLIMAFFGTWVARESQKKS